MSAFDPKQKFEKTERTAALRPKIGRPGKMFNHFKAAVQPLISERRRAIWATHPLIEMSWTLAVPAQATSQRLSFGEFYDEFGNASGRLQAGAFQAHRGARPHRSAAR